MILQPEIDALFSSCQRGDLILTDPGLPQVSTLRLLRDANNRSLLDVAITYKHSCIFSKLLTHDFLPTAQDCSRALKLAVDTADVTIIEQVNTAIHKINHANPMPCFEHSYAFTCNELLTSACIEGNTALVRCMLTSIPSMDVHSPLTEAWVRGHLDIVRALIDAGATHHFDVPAHRTTLFRDVVKGSLEYCPGDREPIIDLLLSNGAKWDLSDYFCWELLLGCATVPLLHHLLALPHINMYEQRLELALKGACLNGNLAVMPILLGIADKRRFRLEDSIGKLFDFALKMRHREIAEMLFPRLGRDAIAARERNRDDYSEDGWDQYTPLSVPLVATYAIICNSVIIVREMLSIRQVNINRLPMLFCECEEHTALTLAADPAMVRLLLDARASVNPQQGYQTTLRGACEQLQIDSVKMLLEAGADVNQGGRHSALYYAVCAECPDDRLSDKMDLINLLFRAGAAAYDDNGGPSIFHKKLSRERFREVDVDVDISPVFALLLHRYPAMLHYRDKTGATALLVQLCEIKRSRWIVQALIDAGADLFVRDDKNQSAFYYLLSCANVVVDDNGRGTDDVATTRVYLQRLLAAGVDPTVCPDDGNTLLMHLLAKDSRESIFPCCLSDAACSSLMWDILASIASRTA